MSDLLGRVKMHDTGFINVYSDGKAIVEEDQVHANYVYYRWPDGTWRNTLVEHRGYASGYSLQLEEIYSAWVASLVMEPRLPR